MEEELNGLKLHGGQVGQLSWWGLSPRAPYASRPWERRRRPGAGAATATATACPWAWHARTPRAHRATRRPRRGACRHGTPAWGSVHTPPHGVTKPAAGRGAATTTTSSKSGRVSAAAGRAALSAPRSCLLVDASGIQPEFCSDI